MLMVKGTGNRETRGLGNSGPPLGIRGNGDWGLGKILVIARSIFPHLPHLPHQSLIFNFFVIIRKITPSVAINL
jgi:hypothetical protein